MTELVMRNVDITYKMKKGNFKAVENINLEISKGKFICLIGRSGCGKTTTLHAIAGLNPVSNGEILLDSKTLTGPGADRGMVFQNDSVFPWLTVAQNVAFGLRMKGLKKSDIEPVVKHYLELVGLWQSRDLYPRELSGGMRKRVDLARSFANDPEILLMDEPFGSLDAMTKEALQVAILQLWEEAHKTIIFITHDVEEALFLSEKTVVMEGPPGRIKNIMDIPFGYPRDVSLKLSLEFLKYRAKLMDQLIIK
ncbi:MAG: ABC transporter ATP-binding protein [Spirochaetes bacterium]|nr:ABC transporter ATP-binding protein [Spirochaetota bacterium]